MEDAIRQYRSDRDPREPLFSYGRCLAHFAVDPDLVYVTTHLQGPKTRFLPLNQGRFGGAVKDFLFDIYLRGHRQADELLKQNESKTLEFKSTLRWNLKEQRKDPTRVTHAVLKTIAAFLNTEGGDLLIGVADDRAVLGIEADRFESDDRFLLHLTQVARNALGDRAGTCIDPRMQVVKGKTICLVSCQRSPEPVFLKWKDTEEGPDGDFYVCSGPGTVKLSPEDAGDYIRTRFPAVGSP